MALRVYNTLSRQKEDFQTVQPGKVGMYLCGPTVYKPSHVGHMVGPVIFDTVRRYLQYRGYQVRFVVNITDVDDKLIVRARELNTTVKELAEKMTANYLECLRSLGVEGITDMPRATEHIPEMIAMIGRLIQKGHAYPAAGDVYFDVNSDPDYGKLCHRDPEQMEAGARIEVSERKRNPGDFALWKGAKPGEPAWPSPWGAGRPGWHIECSAMSMKYLGETLDIHGGGLDLKFPHHENELAQSESFSEQPFARYWMHNGLMTLGATKMAGSVGNVMNVADVLEKHSAETLRFLLLGTHYRSPIEYSEDRLQEVKRSIDGFYRFFERYERITKTSFYKVTAPTTQGGFASWPGDFGAEIDELRIRFLECMDDDFNTGGAVGVMYELLTALNRFADARQLEGATPSPETVQEFERAVVVFREVSQLLGLFREAPPAATKGGEQLAGALQQLLLEFQVEGWRAWGQYQTPEQLMPLVIELRASLRKAKNFAQADQVRKRLGELGVTLEDRAGGTGWRIG